MRTGRYGLGRAFSFAWCIAYASAVPSLAQQLDSAAVIQRVEASVETRFENVLGFTDIEHYAVFRGKDETHPVATMTVRDTYQKGVGKKYTILSQSGSAIIQKFGLRPLLDNEMRINNPATVRDSWFTSANYVMKLKPGSIQQVDGRDCLAISISPRHKAPNMIDGTLWVDAKDSWIVKVEGVASKSPSIWAGTTKMMRQYTLVDGYSQAMHARAESDSFLFGHTVVVVDYGDYHLQLRPAQ
ncbi:MAG: hypothetical protein ACLGRW_17655 [Acidobacteriota bacterium]